MKTLIVYDSVFGNTEQRALAMGNSFGSGESVVTLRVSEIKPEQLTGLGLLIVRSPTRAFRPTNAISNFLHKIPAKGLKGVTVAAFDTRMAAADMPGTLGEIALKI